MPRKLLNLEEINTIEDLNAVSFWDYEDESDPQWIRHLVYPVSQDNLDKVCELSWQAKAEWTLVNSMGDLYHVNRKGG